MIYAFDSYYINKEVNTSCVGFLDWSSTKPEMAISEKSEVLSDYVSGQFYKRELPGIIQIIDQLDLQAPDILVVDGYVYLDDQKSNGLGGYLYEAIGKSNPVIGVAKKAYKSLDQAVREVYRGESKKPLYVTAMGFDLDYATKCITGMTGKYRIPDLLKLVDQYSKGSV